MEAIDPRILGLEFAGGALVGGLIGLAAKKIAKLLAIIIGFQLIAFRYLESQGIIIVDWSALSAGLIATSERADPTFIESFVTTLSLGVGFTAGFLIGFHRG